MSLLMTIRIAFKALGRNKLRTALTMLGMIIGVAAVIAMVALGIGRAGHDRGTGQVGRHQPDHDLAGQHAARGGVRTASARRRRWCPRTRRRCAICRKSQYVAESVSTRTQLIYGNQNWNTNIEGTNVDLPAIRSWPMKYGSFFSR